MTLTQILKIFDLPHFLPVVSKIIEEIIHNQTMTLLHKYQSGFRKNHSTNTRLSQLTDRILTGFDSGILTGMVLIDLQKAFEVINHKVLLKRCPLLVFQLSRLLGLNLTSQIGNFKSISKINSLINCGLPQGSILGPLLLLICVDDMFQALDCALFLTQATLVYTAQKMKFSIKNFFNKLVT